MILDAEQARVIERREERERRMRIGEQEISVAGFETDLVELASHLLEKYGNDYPIPKAAMSKWMAWTFGPMNGISRRYVTNNVEVPWRADNSKSKRDLGLTYRGLKPGVEEMFQQMIDTGAFKNR